jgi:moderate conductance mechanosensitive channel
VAYVACEGIVTPRIGVPDEEGVAASNATRLATIIPLLRIAFLTLVAIVASLVVMSNLGVDITPIVTGAGCLDWRFPLAARLWCAISSPEFSIWPTTPFASANIDCGSAKETVEGFTLRSMRLRHQNGQVQTIPFGQLGQITNFSRDWTTMKFNLRLARYGSRKLRKTTKKSGSP